MEVKCKHCCKPLFNGEIVRFLTSHSEIRKNAKDTGCEESNSESCLFISADEMPEALEQLVNQESWTKGRIHCLHCNNRVGSFNFVNEMKCNCGKYITPPIRIILSKVDVYMYE